MNIETKWYVKKPWVRTHSNAKQRCTNVKLKCYKNYGGRGIKFYLTVEQLKTMWFRDKAFDMSMPTIDRVNADGHYTYENCRYLELADNAKRQTRRHTREILQYDHGGNFVRKWNTATEAAKSLGILNTSIANNCSGLIRSTRKGIFKYV